MQLHFRGTAIHYLLGFLTLHHQRFSHSLEHKKTNQAFFSQHILEIVEDLMCAPMCLGEKMLLSLFLQSALSTFSCALLTHKKHNARVSKLTSGRDIGPTSIHQLKEQGNQLPLNKQGIA